MLRGDGRDLAPHRQPLLRGEPVERSSVENQGVARADGRLEAMGDISEHDPDAAPASRMCSCARHGLRDVVDAGRLPTPAGQVTPEVAPPQPRSSALPYAAPSRAPHTRTDPLVRRRRACVGPGPPTGGTRLICSRDECTHSLVRWFALASARVPEVRSSAGTRGGGGHHGAKLAELVVHVAEAIDRFRGGELDAFDVDEVLFQYSRAARELWKFCNVGDVELTAGQLHDGSADRLVGTRITNTR